MTPPLTNADPIMVCLAQSAKLLGRFHKPGDIIAVDSDTARQLAEAGLLKDTPAELTDAASGMPGFDEAVAVTAKALAEGMVEAVVEQAMAEFTTEKDALLARAIEAEAQRDVLQERVLELQAELEALNSGNGQKAPTGSNDSDPQTFTAEIPPAAQAAKTAPKKGTAAKKG